MTAGSVTVTLAYDADGNRVAKTVNGVTTRYLVDDLNPTGYAQVVEEVTAGAVTRQYTYGLQRISQTQQIASVWTPSFYGYDGAGTVRLLTDSTGTVTDTYDYDAWGNTVNTTGSTPNVYLYRGEQNDSDLGFYYLRARFYSSLTGRFLSADPEADGPADPSMLHRYLYTNADPVNRADPTGRSTTGSAEQAGLMMYDALTAGGYLVFMPGPLAQVKVALPKPKCLWTAGGTGGGPAPASGGGAPPPCTPGEVCICARAGWQNTVPGGVANHVYFWDTKDGRICGRGADSKVGHENPKAPGTACVGIQGSADAGKANAIMKCCKDLNNSPATWPIFFLPPVWDCHNFVNHCVLKVGLTPPPHPGGRLGDRCPEPACQVGPWPGPEPPPLPWGGLPAPL
jgi:RHS repeat-associated protein